METWYEDYKIVEGGFRI